MVTSPEPPQQVQFSVMFTSLMIYSPKRPNALPDAEAELAVIIIRHPITKTDTGTHAFPYKFLVELLIPVDVIEPQHLCVIGQFRDDLLEFSDGHGLLLVFVGVVR